MSELKMCHCTGSCPHSYTQNKDGILRLVKRKGWFRANGIPELSKATAFKMLNGSKARVKWAGSEEWQSYDD